LDLEKERVKSEMGEKRGSRARGHTKDKHSTQNCAEVCQMQIYYNSEKPKLLVLLSVHF